MAFSPSGKYLGAAAMDDSHCLAVYEWQKKPDSKKGTGPLFASGKGTPDVIMNLCFDPNEA